MERQTTFAEERIAPWPAGHAAEGCTVSGHMFTLIEEPEIGVRFVWDGVPGGSMQGIAQARDGSTLVWSDDGAHVAFTGVRGGKQLVVRDGVEGPAFESVSGSVRPTFSPEGGRLAYGATIDGVPRLLVDGEIVGEEMLAPISIAFSHDGRRLAHVELRGTRSSPETRIVVDGLPTDWFNGMRNAPNVLQFSPNGWRFAYYRIDGRGHGQWIVDGDAQQWVNDVRPLSWAQLRGVGILDPPLLARWSPDSARFVYAADVEGRGVAMVEDDRPGPLVKAIGDPIFSPDGRRLAYTVQTHSKATALVVDGLMSAEFRGEPSYPVFSPDGRRVAFATHREEGPLWSKRHVISVIVDGEVMHEEPGLDFTAKPVFSPDGARLAYWIEKTKGDRRMFIDGVLQDGPMTMGEPSFDAAGELVYVGVSDAGQTLVTDGRLGPLAPYVLFPLGGVPIEFRESLYHFRHSPDGRHVAWAQATDEGAMPVLDDRIGPRYDQIINWSFADSGQATWWATRDEGVFRITASV